MEGRPLSLACQQADNSFRVPVQGCRDFDFSLLFEETILGILPLGILLVISPFRLWFLSRKPRKVAGSWALWIKTVTWVILGAIHFALVALWSLPSAARTHASIATSTVTAVGVICLSVLSYSEHTHSARPSFLLNVYLFITLLFDVAKTRTLWLRDIEGIGGTIAIVTSVATGVKFLLLLLETLEKRRLLKHEYRDYSPEATAGFFNRALFLWLNPLFKNGFFKQLAVDDLFTLDKNLGSQRLQDALEANWNQIEKPGDNALLFTIFRTFAWQLLAAIVPRACLVGLNVCQPLLLHRSLSFSAEPDTSNTTNAGYGLIGAYILVYTGMAVSMGQYQHLTYRVITMVRGGVVSMVYKKASTLSVKDADPAASLTLMSADIERIVQGWQTIHDIWGNTLEIALAIFLLERELGISCVVPVGVSLVALVGSLISLSLVVSRQAMWLEAIERRISSTGSMLASMKGIKLLGLSHFFMTHVHGLRLEELKISKSFRKILVWNLAFAWMTRIFAPIFTFGAFVGISHSRGNDSALNTSNAYTSLSLFALLSDPLLSLVMALMTFVGSVGSFKRIQEFLQMDSHVDSRHGLTSFPVDVFNESKIFGLIRDSDCSTDESSSSQSVKATSLPLPYEMITIQRGSFGWNGEKAPLLKDLTITVPRQSFSVIVGPSGCGKSTLLKAILGETPCLGGSLALSSQSIAYCDQVPWHMNATIKDSVVAMSCYDEKWYNSVVEACALVEDFRQLPRGDQTVIGSKGIALSGGQSQRIALARAVYARKDIVILDDVLSSLDAATEDHIFHHLLGIHGLLRSIGSTVLFASSSVKRIPYADHIVVLDTEGRVSEQGSFKALDPAGGYVSGFSLGAPDWDFKAEGLPAPEIPKASVGSNDQDKEYIIDKFGSGGDVSIYLYYVRSIGWVPTMVFIVAITGFVFCISFPSIWIKWWARSNETDPGKQTGYYIGIYAMLGAVGMISLIIGCRQMIISMVPKSGEKFHRQLLSKVLSAPMQFFASTDTGAILNRFSQDLQLIDMELPVAAINTFVTFVLCLCQMVFMGIASKYAAISFPLVIFTIYSIQKIYLRTSRQLRFLDLEAKAPLYAHFTDCLGGLTTVRAFGWQQALQDKNHRLLDYSQRPFYFLYAIQRWLTLTLDMVVAGIAVLLIILVVTLRGSIGSGYVGVALLNVILFSQSIKLLVTFWTNLETHIGSILRVKSFSENVASEDQPDENGDVPPEWPSRGEISFEAVSAEYRASEPVLQDISFAIQAGEKVAICGRTGSGKTSLIMSIFRMVDLTSGNILIDGIDISQIPRQEIRSRINGVSQSPLLIQGSVRQNVDPTCRSSDDAIMAALKTVHLSTKIREKGGLDTNIDDLFLSQGQKQLFCLARAILRSGNILVLDEATSSVDTKTDEIMQRIIREKFANHTIITVAHKLETILDYDRVIVLDAGRIIESGNPYTLLGSESHFSKLYAKSVLEESE
ncbi:ABC multidrug transporter [Aspergillus steynii IBT 23096]|uniref:ABC multidrug transporter n=1 Tax=Aspergillus steynii IBT 23096 TaxID=1392250 RepID=A0A2I2FTI4_9EURO|nr:ABC multidrug transporter [Aspergillus steynii IBT 23096]PLB43887.1 ABC multidrug transporter [Aspergillus steynii IBT 23096]